MCSKKLISYMKRKNQVAIVVGRFQVDKLTTGHEKLLETAIKESDKVIIFIGDTKGSVRTEHDPLPYEARKEMIKRWYGYPLEEEKETTNHSRYNCIDGIDIFRIEDLGNYPRWVEMLDRKIESLIDLEVIPRGANIFIYGSRDSVAERYKENGGKYETREVSEEKEFCTGFSISGTERRKRIHDEFSPKWDNYSRRLVIYMMKGK